jgi:hypothetical protein
MRKIATCIVEMQSSLFGQIQGFQKESLEATQPAASGAKFYEPDFTVRVARCRSSGVPGRLRVVAISDTHNRLDEFLPALPAGDVLLHCGDWTNKGKPEEVEQFNSALARASVLE